MNATLFFAMLNSVWVPGLILAHLYIIFFVYLVFSARYLPGRVTTQFGLLGKPGTQMTRRTYVIFMTVFSIWVPLFCLFMMVFFGTRPESVHIANHAYWFSAEHIAETRSYLTAHALWFASLMLAFLFGLHFVLVRANRQQPPRLPWPLLLALLVCLAGAVVFWSTGLVRHFKHIRLPSAEQTG